VDQGRGGDREASEALASGDAHRIREELGDALFSLVNVARLATLDAEEALHGAIEKFRQRFTDMEAELAARGTSISAWRPTSSSARGAPRKPRRAARSGHEASDRSVVRRDRAR